VASSRKVSLTRDDVMTATEVAELLRATSTVYDLARRRILPGHRVGRAWLHSPRDRRVPTRSVTQRSYDLIVTGRRRKRTVQAVKGLGPVRQADVAVSRAQLRVAEVVAHAHGVSRAGS
jgi:excisionase family DNA binding protein